MEVKQAKEFKKELLEDILRIEKRCFPDDWQYSDAEEYYKEMLRDRKVINLFLVCDGKNVGYLLATPLDYGYNEIAEGDPLVENDKERYYLETIEIIPEYQGKGGSKKLLFKMCNEAKKRGVEKFSVHARIKNGLDKTIKNIFEGNITKVRKVKNWKYGGNEPYEYIEWNI